MASLTPLNYANVAAFVVNVVVTYGLVSLGPNKSLRLTMWKNPTPHPFILYLMFNIVCGRVSYDNDYRRGLSVGLEQERMLKLAKNIRVLLPLQDMPLRFGA
jgi:hypothetical protein